MFKNKKMHNYIKLLIGLLSNSLNLNIRQFFKNLLKIPDGSIPVHLYLFLIKGNNINRGTTYL